MSGRCQSGAIHRYKSKYVRATSKGAQDLLRDTVDVPLVASGDVFWGLHWNGCGWCFFIVFWPLQPPSRYNNIFHRCVFPINRSKIDLSLVRPVVIKLQIGKSRQVICETFQTLKLPPATSTIRHSATRSPHFACFMVYRCADNEL